MSDELLVAIKGPVLELTLNRPEKYNAINEAVLAGLSEQVGRFNADSALQVLLLRGRGRFFSAGGDVNSAMFPDLSHNSPAKLRAWLLRGDTSLTPLAEAIAATEKVTVVAHQGPCLGGALELSLAFDFRIAAVEASYGLPETRFGSVPVTGGVARLTSLVGPHWARWLLVAGQTIDATKAERIGLIHVAHRADEFDAQVQLLCDSLIAMPPEAAGAAKLAIDLAAELGTASARTVERIASSSLVFGTEYRDALAKLIERLNRER